MVREMERPETSLPEPGFMTPAEHIQIRDRLWEEHLPIEMDKGNRLQASEKIWGSVAHAVNAIAKDRGWRHGDRDALRDVVIQLGAEQDSPTIPKKSPYRMESLFNNWFNTAEGVHNNFYRNHLHTDAIKLAEGSAEQLISRLEDLQGKQPKRFAPKEDDLRRLGRLLDIRDPDNPRRFARPDYLKQVVKIGVPEPNGFSPNYGYQKPGTPGDDGSEATPESIPRPGSPPPEGSRANPIPKSVQGTTPNFGLKPGKQLGQDDAVAGPSATGRRPRQTKNGEGKTPKVTVRFG